MQVNGKFYFVFKYLFSLHQLSTFKMKGADELYLMHGKYFQ